MSGPALMPWTVDKFCAWQDRQQDRYERVNGFPVRMMAGARNVHDDIVVNLLAELRGNCAAAAAVPLRVTAPSKRCHGKFDGLTQEWTAGRGIRRR